MILFTDLKTWTDATFTRRMHQLGFPVGERTMTFFHGLRWNALAASISRVLCGLCTLFVARWLGPGGFGEANLALAAAFWIQAPLFLGGSTALMHFVPQAESKERARMASAGLILLTLTGTSTLILSHLGAPWWAKLQGISTNTFELGLIWCAGYAVYINATSLLSSYERFSTRAKCEIVFALLFAAAIASMWKIRLLNPTLYIVAFAGAYAISGLIGLWQGWPKPFSVWGNSNRIKKLLSYGALASMGSIVNAMFNAPGRLVVNHYLLLPDVGVLSAYQGGSIQMAYFFIGVAFQVLFPIASRTPNRAILFQKMNRFMFLSSLPLVGMYAILLTLFMSILGKHYPIHTTDLITFSIAAVFTTFHGLFSMYLSSGGMSGVVMSSIAGLIAGGVNIAACFYCIPRWGITGAGLAQTLACFVGISLYQLPLVRELSLISQKNLTNSSR